MQINRRTSALLSAGVISFAAVVRAEEKASPLSTALASTSISGYVIAPSGHVQITAYSDDAEAESTGAGHRIRPVWSQHRIMMVSRSLE